MAQSELATKTWAVLIGINFYGRSRRNLKGAVRDIESIKQYLTMSLTLLETFTFTASANSDLTSCNPTEDPNTWPTYENITACLDGITSEAKPGDLLYIHYSGHGTRKKTTLKIHDMDTGELALVLFGAHGPRCFYGSDLANRLNELSKRGVVITLILDCCFSGSLVRNGNSTGSSIRTIDYDAAFDTAYAPDVASIDIHVKSQTFRDGHMLPNWLVKPNGYTILAACGPYEEAKELQCKGGEWNGALSYFLLDALWPLKHRGAEVTIQSLHQYLCAQFHAHWPQQNPMRYGTQNLSLFGKLRPEDKPSALVVREKTRFYLEAGHAHGVHEGDEYAVYPAFPSEDVFHDETNAICKVRVEVVRSLTSELREIEGTSDSTRVQTGWKARLLTRSSLNKTPVRLVVPESERSLWIEAEKLRRFPHLHIEGVEEGACPFIVIRNPRNEYEFLNASNQKIIGMPVIPVVSPVSSEFVLSVLEHLATFKAIEGIENRNAAPSFVNSFKISLSDGKGQNLENSVFIDVDYREIITLSIQNFSNQRLYLGILDLTPSWRISNLISDGYSGNCKVVPAKGDSTAFTTARWRMIVPESFLKQGHTQCEDVIKVFVTSKQVSFASLALPKVPSFADGPFRGHHSHNQVSEFLSELVTPSRGPVNDVQEDWTTLNFIVRTHHRKSRSQTIVQGEKGLIDMHTAM